MKAANLALIWGAREYKPTNEPMHEEVSVVSVRKKIAQVLGQEQSTYTEWSGRASLRRQ